MNIKKIILCTIVASLSFIQAEELGKLEDEVFYAKPGEEYSALAALADGYRDNNLKYEEFLILENIINNYPSSPDYEKYVNRQYDIAMAYELDYRQPLLPKVPLMQWLKGRNKSMEIYDTATIHNPFSYSSGIAKLRYARICVSNGLIEKAHEIYKAIIQDFPNTEIARKSYLDLADILVQLSKILDNDGEYARAGLDLLNEFQLKYPNDKEMKWVLSSSNQLSNTLAYYIYRISYHYYISSKMKASAMYAKLAISRCPNTEYAQHAEEMLVVLGEENTDYLGSLEKPKEFNERNNYNFKFVSVPTLPKKYLIIPENEKGKWLIPLEELDFGTKYDSELADKPKELTEEDQIRLKFREDQKWAKDEIQIKGNFDSLLWATEQKENKKK